MPSIGRFKEMEMKASKAPWYTIDDPDLPINSAGDVDWPQHLIGDPQNPGMLPHWNFYVREEDAELIVAMRNSLKEWFAVVDAARELSNAWGSEGVQRARQHLNTALQRLEDV